MNFQKLPPVDSGSTYLETAFSKARKIRISPSKRVSRLNNRIDNELKKSTEFIGYLEKTFQKIPEAYPNFDSLPEFYTELIKTTLDIDELKKSLSVITWAKNKISELRRDYQSKLKRTKSETGVDKLRNSFYGRTSSIVERADRHLKNIDSARKKLKNLPDIKDNLFTVCIAGFPNVGKSTLLSKITSSTPEIRNYSFTTKGLNTGYIKDNHTKIQVIDTPGTLARFQKMNNIEKQAYLAIKYVSNTVIFIYDITGEYSIEEQDRLLAMVQKLNKPIIFYLSKTDILPKKEINDFLESRKEVFAKIPKEIMDKLLESHKSYFFSP